MPERRDPERAGVMRNRQTFCFSQETLFGNEVRFFLVILKCNCRLRQDSGAVRKRGPIMDSSCKPTDEWPREQPLVPDESDFTVTHATLWLCLVLLSMAAVACFALGWCVLFMTPRFDVLPM